MYPFSIQQRVQGSISLHPNCPSVGRVTSCTLGTLHKYGVLKYGEQEAFSVPTGFTHFPHL